MENFASITGMAQQHHQQQQIEQQQQRQQHQIHMVPEEKLPVPKADSGQISATPGYQATVGEEEEGLKRDSPPR